MAFAIIETGSKQYRVAPGQKIKIEKIKDLEGEDLVFDKVLLISDEKGVQIGTPYLEKAIVNGRLAAQGRSKKIIVFKYKAKKRYRKKQGHRQSFMEVEITKISA